ncbi:MAG: DUF1843 domain-containing protein [Sphingomonadales bacterium]|nr:DUF1843 domain-containing protein [Sphingomonadales bacterium]
MTIVLYAPAIQDALRSSDTTLDELITLRDHARAVLAQQEDLEGALKELDAELESRGGKAGA